MIEDTFHITLRDGRLVQDWECDRLAAIGYSVVPRNEGEEAPPLHAVKVGLRDNTRACIELHVDGTVVFRDFSVDNHGRRLSAPDARRAEHEMLLTVIRAVLEQSL